MGYETQSHETRMSACMQYHKVLQNAITVHTYLFILKIICHFRDRQGWREVVLSTVHFETLSTATNVYETNFLVTWIQATAFFPTYSSSKPSVMQGLIPLPAQERKTW